MFFYLSIVINSSLTVTDFKLISQNFYLQKKFEFFSFADKTNERKRNSFRSRIYKLKDKISNKFKFQIVKRVVYFPTGTAPGIFPMSPVMSYPVTDWTVF